MIRLLAQFCQMHGYFYQQILWSRVLLEKLAGQEIPFLSWKLKVHCDVHISPPMVALLNLTNLVSS